jgi:hypothetical protein
MAGKGSKLRKGANLQNYWNNFPFDEKNTVTYWKNKFGDKIADERGFRDLAVGAKISEKEYLERLEDCVLEEEKEMTEKDLEDLKNAMNSMSYSEFQKFKK